MANAIITVSEELYSTLERIHTQIVDAAEHFDYSDVSDALDREMISTLQKLSDYTAAQLEIDPNLPDAEKAKLEAQVEKITQSALEKIYNMKWTR